MTPAQGANSSGSESRYAWLRLGAALAQSTIGGVGMWSVVVALPAVQAEFGVARADASLPYTLTMICFGLAGIAMGRLSDRFGIVLPVIAGASALMLGYVAAAFTSSIWQFALAQGLLIGAGSSVTFAPLMADVSQWFNRRRGMAVGIFASGNYLSGALWPPLIQHFIDSAGWRDTYLWIGVFCLLTMVPLALALRRRPPALEVVAAHAHAALRALPPIGLPPRVLQVCLVVAGVGCCVAMSTPQVHIVAYCSDLGYGPARGAQLLSLMLACGIVSRLTFGWISDRIGGLRTLLLGSGLQAVALTLFVPFDGMASLYLISALFGLFQGGIVPSYAIIVREHFPSREAGARVSLVITATLFGMAFGGWVSGAIFDLTGSYRAAFVHGVFWNLVNLAIAGWLLRRSMRRAAAVPA
jgi:MFS family permease